MPEHMRVFLSYRRTDDRHLAGRLRDALANEFGDENVFFDVDSIAAGQDFRIAVREYIDEIDVMLILIGPRWDPTRLALRNDFVRTEIAEALQQGKPIIPVLIDDTPMPPPEDFPDELAQISYLNALAVRPDPDFRADAARVSRAMHAARDRTAAEQQSALARQQEHEARVGLAEAEAATAQAAQAAADAELARSRAERAAAEQARLAAEAETIRLRAETDRERERAEALRAERARLASELEAERAQAQQAQAEQADLLAAARAEEEHARATAQHLQYARKVADDHLIELKSDSRSERRAPDLLRPASDHDPDVLSTEAIAANSVAEVSPPTSKAQSTPELAGEDLVGGTIVPDHEGVVPQGLEHDAATRPVPAAGLPEASTPTAGGRRSRRWMVGLITAAATLLAVVVVLLTARSLRDKSSTSESPPPGTMQLNLRFDPRAVWDDGSPIGLADLRCTLAATLNTPESLRTTGYELITAIEPGEAANDVIIRFSEPYAAYRSLFPHILKAGAIDNCDNVSADLLNTIPFSGRQWQLETWSDEQLTLVRNEAFGDSEHAASSERITMIAQSDLESELNSLQESTVDFIYPETLQGPIADFAAPSVEDFPVLSSQFEALYFQQLDGPLADDALRIGLSMSIDRELIHRTFYEPISPGSTLLNCGPWLPTIGDWCDDTQFAGSFDPTGAETVLATGGWVKNEDGLWSKDGVVPEIRWMLSPGFAGRRERTQDLVIPHLGSRGFNVIASNPDTSAVYVDRLRTLDYDIAMYVETASPDPSVTAKMSCDQIPGTTGDSGGTNVTGWCNSAASDLMHLSDRTLDKTQRLDMIHRLGQYLVDDAVMLPLFQFPRIAAYRTDLLEGPAPATMGSFQGFAGGLWSWKDLDGDGQVVIAVERWPKCLNPITCYDVVLWYDWTVGLTVFPALWDVREDGEYVHSYVLEAEPEVILG